MEKHQKEQPGLKRHQDLFVKIEKMTPGEYKNGGESLNIQYQLSKSFFGDILLAATRKGICNIMFADEMKETVALRENGEKNGMLRNDRSTEKPGTACWTEKVNAFQLLSDMWPNASLTEGRNHHIEKAESVFAGILGKNGEPGKAGNLGKTGGPGKTESLNKTESSSKMKELKVHIHGSEFQHKVWESLLRIPEGCLSTYSTIASEIGSSRACRAVGSAVGKNPVAYLIPCHRVIRKEGGIGEYRWGDIRKKAIIGWEAARRGSL